MLGQVTHRFVRNTGYASSIFNRQGNRHYPFENTLRILEDPQNGRKLYLIGTTNSSTLLAYRTQALLQKIKPDSVFVQTNKRWWELVSSLQNVNDQATLNNYNPVLQRAFDFDGQIDNNPRGLLFKAKFYTWLWFINWYKAFPTDFHPFTPGLEMKLALEEALKQNTKVVLGGLAIDEQSLSAFKTEARFDVVQLFRKVFTSVIQKNRFWFGEHLDNYAILDVNGGEAYAESMDYSRINWFVKYFEAICPNQKRILVDQKDIDIFYSLYRDCPGKNIVAVVNQWHMPGIEQHWRQTTGTVEQSEPINPIGDMDIEKYMESQLVNDTLRAFNSKTTKSEPASWKNYNTMYIKDNYEPERVRHVNFKGHEDPHMMHGLPYEYNEDMTKKHHGDVPAKH